jgi:hypothetical protein
MTKLTITVPRSEIRNPYAQSAMGRRAGAFKHRSAPRGGGRNLQRDFMEEYSDAAEDAE